MKITTPGLYADLPIETYHSNCCEGPSVSASVLHKMLSACPAIMWESSYLNPNRVPEPTTASFDIGRAAHALTLGEPEFAKYFIISPYDEFRTKEAREWRDAQTQTIIKSKDFETILAISQAQRRSPQVARAFEDGRPECSLIWLDAETGVWLKSRPDWLPHDPAVRPVVDYKTCRSIEPRKMSQDVFVFGYHLQAAMQVDAVKATMGIEPAGIAHVCQEKSIPYLAELRMFDEQQLNYGRREYRRALRLFADCWEKHLAGKPTRSAWPGYTTQPEYFQSPIWVQQLMDDASAVPPIARADSEDWLP